MKRNEPVCHSNAEQELIMDRTLSAFFDNRSDAISAVDDLVAMGVSRQQISVVSGSEPPEEGAAGGGYGTPEEERGFWASLADLFVPEEDVNTYQEGVNRGGATLIARIDETAVGRAVEILEEHDAVDLNQREQEWRADGWGGPYRPGAASAGIASATTAAAALPTSETAARETAAAPTTPEVTTGATGEEQVIPVTREELHVGKRAQSGRVRIHTHVVEEPVSEDVRLRNERVTIERTPVDKPATGAGEDAPQHRTMEIEEYYEEPVVSKEGRVTEEVRVRKEAEEHVERVEDTVRHTEVEIEDDRASGERTTKEDRRK